jgi:hypothetical protein
MSIQELHWDSNQFPIQKWGLFLRDLENQGIARRITIHWVRRTRNPADWRWDCETGNPPPKGVGLSAAQRARRKRTISGWKLTVDTKHFVPYCITLLWKFLCCSFLSKIGFFFGQHFLFWTILRDCTTKSPLPPFRKGGNFDLGQHT